LGLVWFLTFANCHKYIKKAQFISDYELGLPVEEGEEANCPK
jgi:hypothetical protein